ncbi:MAG: hypothetical protein H6R18_588 [Proteobacteria bacterium]|nr:hypothetical protein [Pseudomonadota bacterium]
MATELNTSSGSFHDKKQLLVNDMKGVVGDANDILKQVAHSTAEEIGAVRTAVTEKAKCVASATNEYVRESPWRTLGIVAAAGLVVGFLLNRR